MLEGIQSVAETDAHWIDLYDYNYKGCRSYFSCKRIGGSSYGVCAVRDELTPVLEEDSSADILLFGSSKHLR